MPLAHAALIALGFGFLSAGSTIRASTGRRDFVGLALLALGALAATGCGPDAPGSDVNVSPCPCGASGDGDSDDGGGADGGYASSGDDAGGGGDGSCAGDDTGDDSSGGAG
jgi:hypothetical protein